MSANVDIAPAEQSDLPSTAPPTHPIPRPSFSLLSYPLGKTPTSLGLLSRLQRENHWTTAFTDAAVQEYLRFCILARLTHGRVSPSPIVDTVWHTHLLYSIDYWNHFCPIHLQFSLHHVPNSGTPDVTNRLKDQYSHTLTLYEDTFGEIPPSRFWPPPGTPHPVRLTYDPVRHILFPRLPGSLLALLAILLVSAFALLSMGAGPLHPPLPQTSPLNFTGPRFLLFYSIAFSMAFVAAALLRRFASGSTHLASPNFMPEPYELAYLSQGPSLTASAAIASLAARKLLLSDQGILSLHPDLKGRPLPPSLHPLELEVCKTLSHGPRTFVTLQKSLAGPLLDIKDNLISHGLVPDTARATSLRLFSLFIALSVPALGLVKVATGLSRDKPVAFLVIFILISCLFSFATLTRPLLRTPAGNALLTSIRRKASRNQILAELSHLTPPPASAPPRSAQHAQHFSGIDPVTLGIALYGLDFLHNTPLAPLRHQIQPPSSNSNSSSYADSSSDSSSGSGCGGCGGGGGD